MFDQLFEDSNALGLHQFGETFGTIRKLVQNRKGGYIPKRHGFIKSYMNVDLVVIVHMRSWRHLGEKYLVFHRTPRSSAGFVPREPRHGTGGLNDRRCGGDTEAESMLSVGELGQFPNCVVAPGVTISSKVWLFPCYDIPKFGGNGALVKASGEVVGGSTPREMEISFSRNLFNRTTCSVDSLVKRVPEVLEGFESSSLNGFGKWSGDPELMDFISRLRLYIDDFSIGCSWLCKGGADFEREELDQLGIDLVECFPCPSDTFLRAIKM